jgi:signal transduction histidine kinase
VRPLTLRTKIFFIFLGASLLTVVPTLGMVAHVVEQRVYERATEELRRGGEALSINWGLQDEILLGDARVRALDPEVPALLQEGDTVRLRRVLSWGVAEGRMVLALDSLGERLLGPALDTVGVGDRLRSGSAVFTGLPSGPLRAALWPVMQGDTLVGAVGVGMPMDQRAAERMAEVAGHQVALVVGGEIVATTLHDTISAELAARPLAGIAEGSGTWRVSLGELPYLYRVQAISAAGGTVSTVLFRPVSDELRTATAILGAVGVIGVLALLLALLIAGMVARIVARPTQALAKAATHIARGDYGTPLPRGGGDEIGQLANAFAEMRDAIAEREARLREAQTELVHREKLAAMGRLVAQLSHEINNPIYNIQNCLEALARRGDPNDPNREFLDLARDELDRMAGLTRQLLDQSRPLSEAAAPTDLNALVQRVLSLAAQRLEERRVELRLELDPDLPEVVVHADAIQQVLANLVGNALDAMPSGGILTLTTRAAPETVEIEVEDSGQGIGDADLPRIFEAFYSTKPGIRGMGLGLFVSEGIVRGHGGTLRAESRVGEGSRFRVRLPRDPLAPRFLEADTPATAEAHG